MDDRKLIEGQFAIKTYVEQLEKVEDIRWGLRIYSRSAVIRDLLDLGLLAYEELWNAPGVHTHEDMMDALRCRLTGDCPEPPEH